MTRTWRSHVQEAIYRDDAFTMVQYLVPGGEHGYVITFTTPGGMTPETDAEVTRVVDSFRLLDRPPRFGCAMREAALGALGGGAVGGLLLLVRLARQRGGGPLVLATLLLLAGCQKAFEIGPPQRPLEPERFASFLPAAPVGWTEGERKLLDPDQAKLGVPASMAAREYRRGEYAAYRVASRLQRRDKARLAALIVDGGGNPQVNAMFLSERRSGGSRHLMAPLPERNGWPTVERVDEDGERELVAAVGGRFIVRIASRDESAEELRKLFDSMDLQALASTR